MTDLERAADLPYDTDIGEGAAGYVANSDDEAFRENVLTTTRNNAVLQVKQMVGLIEDIASTMVRNSVIGEETTISTHVGGQMTVSKCVMKPHYGLY